MKSNFAVAMGFLGLCCTAAGLIIFIFSLPFPVFYLITSVLEGKPFWITLIYSVVAFFASFIGGAVLMAFGFGLSYITKEGYLD